MRCEGSFVFRPSVVRPAAIMLTGKKKKKEKKMERAEKDDSMMMRTFSIQFTVPTYNEPVPTNQTPTLKALVL